MKSAYKLQLNSILSFVRCFRRPGEQDEDIEDMETARTNQVTPFEKIRKEKTNMKAPEQDDEEQTGITDYTYVDCAVLLDRFNFVIFSLITVCVTLGFMLCISLGDGFD